MIRASSPAALVVVAALLWTCASTCGAQQTAQVDQIVSEYAFKTLLHHDGRKSLEEFRGSPVLVHWWGPGSQTCLAVSVPHVIDMHRKHAKDGLVCILVEWQKMPPGDLPGFLLREFPKSRCFATTETPFRIEGGGPDQVPFTAVLGVDGTLLGYGVTDFVVTQCDQALVAELKKTKSGWGRSPDAIKARALMHGKAKYAEAGAVLKAAEKRGVPPEVRDDFDGARRELETKLAVGKRAVDDLMKEGRYVDARRAALAFQTSVKGDAELEKQAVELVAKLAEPTAAAELKVDEALQKLLDRVGVAPRNEIVSALEDLAKKNDGGKVAVRAKACAAGLTATTKK
ncbi:MAG TPA: hypothetical protein VEI02_03900 [Planctomycetota bacterium]|nr:hypothetical protein [Planctomycetota bacterium]